MGDQLTIATSGLCTRILAADGGLGGTGTLTYVSGGNTVNYPIGIGGTPGLDNPSTVTYTGTVVGGARIEIRDSGGGGVIQSWLVTVVAEPATASTATALPADVIQQFGMPATGTCDEAEPEGLNWSGVANGGWGVSWAEWMNGGAGGVVCTRTLVYSTTQSKWVVG